MEHQKKETYLTKEKELEQEFQKNVISHSCHHYSQKYKHAICR